MALTDGQWTAIGTGASGLLQGAAGLAGAALQYKYNKRLMKQQNQYNIDMWKMQADYNSPQAQMQRFQEAGLNPNLIYGQGSNGNMSSAPEQVVPQAPDYTKGMQDLAKAFNIAGLRKAVADAKHAEADAANAALDVKKNEADILSDEAIGNKFYYDVPSGRFLPFESNKTLFEGRSHPMAASYAFKKLAQNRISTYLLPSRAGYYNMLNRLNAPEIEMREYEAKNKKASYWIGQGTKILNSFSNFIPVFSPLKWSPRPTPSYNRTYINY